MVTSPSNRPLANCCAGWLSPYSEFTLPDHMDIATHTALHHTCNVSTVMRVHKALCTVWVHTQEFTQALFHYGPHVGMLHLFQDMMEERKVGKGYWELTQSGSPPVLVAP